MRPEIRRMLPHMDEGDALVLTVLREVMMGNTDLNEITFRIGKHQRREIAEILEKIKATGIVK